MKPVEYMIEARIDIRESVGWYREHDPAVADRFLDELDHIVAEIASTPELGHSSERKTQYLSLDDFPFRVIYRELADKVVVISVFHHKRRRSVWMKRLKSLED